MIQEGKGELLIWPNITYTKTTAEAILMKVAQQVHRPYSLKLELLQKTYLMCLSMPSLLPLTNRYENFKKYQREKRIFTIEERLSGVRMRGYM
ncbi:hypothetical protein H5410_015641 [Solanum commersonii]|uniref:Uncharacterized protein n=1 Tax=Solanum commersonii TaxID=4109 RepID=A0A9J5ZUB1_SOLCO|nr:hypothetical protein H5410_015641 [Solanum commersonii]